MKKTTLPLLVLIAMVLVWFAGCKKDASFETGTSAVSQGTLLDSSGKCNGAVAYGSYVVDSTLTDSNYVLVKINFTFQGKYKLSSDTVNGMWFLDSGYALTPGLAIVRLKAHGKPLLAKTSDYVFSYNSSSYCTFSITVAANANGGGTATEGSSGDYFPNTTASAFTFEYLPKIGSVDSFTVTVQPGLIAHDTLKYSEFLTNTNDAYFFAKNSSGVYFALSTPDFDYTSVFDSVPSHYISYPFLKENAAVGETWQSSDYDSVKVGTAYGKAKAVFTIIAKDINYAVLGQTYQHVINVKRDIMFQQYGGTYTTLVSGNSYYAKGYGMVDQVIPTSSSTSQSVSAKRIVVK